MPESFAHQARAWRDDPSLIPSGEIELSRDPNLIWDDFNHLRPEFYGLLAIVTDRVVIDLIENADPEHPYGLKQENGDPALPFAGRLENFTSSLLMTLNKHTIPQVLRQKQDPVLGPVLDRLTDLTNAFRRTYDGGRYAALSTLLRSGAGTATDATGYCLAATARVVKRTIPEASNDTIAKIAANSGILIKRVALSNVGHLNHVMAMVRMSARNYQTEDPITKVEALELKHHLGDGAMYVDFIGAPRKLASPYYPGTTTSLSEVIPTHWNTLGCCATAKLDGDSAVDKLWQWSVRVSAKEKLFDDPQI